MEHYTYDKKNGLWYKLEGDYYIPCVTVPEVKLTVFSGLPETTVTGALGA